MELQEIEKWMHIVPGDFHRQQPQRLHGVGCGDDFIFP